jgi:hypothetical protein
MSISNACPINIISTGRYWIKILFTRTFGRVMLILSHRDLKLLAPPLNSLTKNLYAHSTASLAWKTLEPNTLHHFCLCAARPDNV